MSTVDQSLRSSSSLPAIAEISREIVRVYSVHHGRGPTKAKTIWRDTIVVCVLQNVFTKPEQVLVDAGRFDQVRSHRQLVHDAIDPLLRQVVEQATGSSVRVQLGQVGADGTASEVFVL